MSQRQHYLPNSDPGKLAWLQNFSTKFSGYAATLGFTPGEAAAITDDFTAYQFSLTVLDTFKTWLQNLVQFKQLQANGEIGAPVPPFPSVPALPGPATPVPAGIFRRMGMTVQRIKGHPAYTDSIGEDLGIIGAELIIDLLTIKPDIKGALDGVRPLIRWKKSIADSINIYADRRDGGGFKFLANDTIPDYIDTHEIPTGQNSAVWDYKARYRVGDDEVGVFSDVITITATKNV